MRMEQRMMYLYMLKSLIVIRNVCCVAAATSTSKKMQGQGEGKRLKQREREAVDNSKRNDFFFLLRYVTFLTFRSRMIVQRNMNLFE